MTKTEYTAISIQIVSEILKELNFKGLSPIDNEPLKDELLTAIDWHCIPYVKERNGVAAREGIVPR